MAIPDRPSREVGKNRSKASLLAMRRVQLKIDLELKHAGQQLTSRPMRRRLPPPDLPAPSWSEALAP